MTLRNLITPEERRKKLKSALDSKQLIRGIEVHNAIGALIANDLKVEVGQGASKKINEFDFFWESSLTDSASKGYPDIEIISFDSRLKTISEILEVTNKPLIVDGDTGGDIHHFEYLIPKLEKAGVSAIIIEDKVFPKRNSLDADVSQEQEDPDKFVEKIRAGKKVQQSQDFMIIARIESLIAGKGLEDALIRSRKYLLGGADGVMIHSKSSSSQEVLEFSEAYQKICRELNLKKPLICVPTTYNSVYESELAEKGFNIVIYANHMLRASYKAMQAVGKMILENERSFETEPLIAPVREIFEKVGFLDIKEKDRLADSTPAVIILAAGENPELKDILGDLPKPLIKICGKTILEHQISSLKKNGLNEIYVVIGYQKEKFDIPGAKYIVNQDYRSKGILHSLMAARDKMAKGFIYLNGDIIFDEKLISDLLQAKEDITMVVDNSYIYHKHEIDKKLDAVITKKGKRKAYQRLRNQFDEVLVVGKNIPVDLMTHEFVGLAKFSKRGAENLVNLYEELQSSTIGEFHGSESFEKATDIDIFQELISRNFKVLAHETNGGWIEVHTKKDLEFVSEILSDSPQE
jgi:phosphoenolpyruvate phosphomutase